jgi:endonuclease/exonuclease/phosphatase family metal-dependent hydrolase
MRLLACFVWLLLVGCAVPTGTSENRAAVDASTISIGTFNIRYANAGDGANAWSHRTEMVYDILREGDFWGLQEALPEQVAAIRAALPAYEILVRSREKDPTKGEACPILYRSSRWELDASDCGTFWLSETPEVAGSKSWDSSLPRIATFGRFVERASGRGLYVFNVHLDHRGSTARLEAARLVAERIASRRRPEPVVLLGDFNTGPTTPPIQAILDHARVDLRDVWRTANPGSAEVSTFNGWEERCRGDRIDYLFASPGLVVESCVVDDRKPNGRWPSDHAPVRSVLRFENAG